jgi:hypothetical protein
MIYFARKGNDVVHHTDIKAMKELDGAEPEQQLTRAEFMAYGNLARVIGGKIFFGRTAKEKSDDEARTRIAEIDAALSAINLKQIRPAAEISHATGNKKAVPADAVAKINALEDEAAALRLERAALVESFDVPY